MKADPQQVLLLLGGFGFMAFLLLKLLTAPGRGSGAYQQARRRLLDAKRRGGDRGMPPQERAAAFRDAASAALEGLQRPGLAAALARRAERLDPTNPDATGLLALALRRAERYAALERLLWQQLADETDDTAPRYATLFEELVVLYDGPLRRPETARALRRMRAAAVSSRRT